MCGSSLSSDISVSTAPWMRMGFETKHFECLGEQGRQPWCLHFAHQFVKVVLKVECLWFKQTTVLHLAGLIVFAAQTLPLQLVFNSCLKKAGKYRHHDVNYGCCKAAVRIIRRPWLGFWYAMVSISTAWHIHILYNLFGYKSRGHILIK